jgi:phosphoribosyl-ATP pyrophosphohydrolase
LIYLEANDVKIEEVMKELEKRKKWIMMTVISLQKY